MIKTLCNLCGSPYYKVVYSFKGSSIGIEHQPVYKITEDDSGSLPLRIVSCLKCGLVYVNPQQEKQKICESYQNMVDQGYIGEEQGRRISARIILKKVTKYKRNGKILDIGCATGFLLDEAKKLGWQVYGVELSKWATGFAKEKYNLDIFEGILKDAGFRHNFFDAVVMIDSIEHLADPKKTLEDVRRILKPGGIICISTPNIESFLSKILSAKWWGIKHSHLYYFSNKTLTNMLDATGFKVLKCTSHARVFSFDYWNKRIKEYNELLFNLFSFISKALFLHNRLIKINFGDQINVLAQKKRSLEFIKEDELQGKPSEAKMKTIVVLPAYNAAKTLELTVKDIPRNLVDEIILVDDASSDNTVEVAKKLGLKVVAHHKNRGYGANQKTCYTKALEAGAEIVVMVHPDYQYDPTVIPKMIEPIQKGEADAVFGSRMMKGGALEGGMPLWKHNANILLSAVENVILGTYLTEYHSGFRAYSAKYLRTVNFIRNSDNFVFDTEMIVQGVLHYLKIEEVPIKTRYFQEASTIKFIPSLVYGLGILNTLFKYILHTKGIVHFKQFE